MSLCAELALEEAVGMSQNRLRDDDEDDDNYDYDDDEDDNVHNTENI